MKKNSLKLIALTILTLGFLSCKKEKPQFEDAKFDYSIANTVPATPATVSERKVDDKLLEDYITYKLESDKAAFFKKEKIQYESSLTKLSNEDFDKMIDNYLINEGNQLIYSKRIKSLMLSPQGEITPTNAEQPADTTEAVWVSPSEWTLLQAIHLISIRNSGLQITSQSYSFSGLTGTMTSSGPLIQSVYNGVTTYRQNYTHSYTQWGITYSSTYTVYGNIYNGQASVNIMARPASQ